MIDINFTIDRNSVYGALIKVFSLDLIQKGIKSISRYN